jgi:hypothetical protein
MQSSEFFVGLDLGQARDFTALAVLERISRDGGWDPVSWERQQVVTLQVRHLERVPLGTSYPLVVSRVAAVMRSLPPTAKRELLVDATGVGRPVVDLLREEDMGCELRPVMVTSGSGESESDGYSKVPKRELITGLQVMFQTDELKIA